MIELIWKKQPDVRFNQLISNLQYEYEDGKYLEKVFREEVGWGIVELTYPDLFNVEDDDFYDFLLKKYKSMN